jgi:hypothetical protein
MLRKPCNCMLDNCEKKDDCTIVCKTMAMISIAAVQP